MKMILTRKRKALLSWVLCLAMAFGFMQVTTLTSYAAPDDLVIAGTNYDSDSNCSGAGWEYVAATHTLTLDGFVFSYDGNDSNRPESAIEYSGSEALTITLQGENSISGCWTAISVNDTIINGTGILNIESESDDETHYTEGIRANNKSLTIDKATLNIDVDGFGVFCDDLIIESGEVTIQAGYDGICPITVTVNDGSLKAVGGRNNGMQVVGNGAFVLINGGTVYAESLASNTDMGSGIYCYNFEKSGKGDVIIKEGSSVIAKAGTSDENLHEQVAVFGILKNEIAGKGWADYTGAGEAQDIDVNLTGEALSYKKIQFPADIKTDPTVTAPTAKSLTCNDTAQALVTEGSATGATLKYALGTNAATAPSDSEFATTVPTGTAAGTYYVWYKAFGDSSHNDSVAACVTVTIAPKSTEEPTPEEPTPEKPTPEEPTPEEPTPEEPTPEEPTPEEPTPEESTPEEPTPEEPTPEEPTPEEPTPEKPTPEEPTLEEPTPEKPTPEEPTPVDPTPATGTLTKIGIYCAQDNPSIIAAFLTERSVEADTVEYRWLACEESNPNAWFVVSDWTKGNYYLSWTPEKSGDFIIVAQARLVGNEEKTLVYDSFGVNFRTVNAKIKDICQMPYEGGYLIGIESTANPNQSIRYEMLVMDLSLFAAGNPNCWVHSVKGQVAEGNALWTIWTPQYGYYVTLFRIYDANDNLLDQTAYGFANAY